MSFAGNQYPNYADKVITTRGDIVRGDSSGDRSRYGIGAANTVLTSDGTDPAWAAAALAPTTTKGDISGFSTTQARIPVGTNNYSIVADSAQALGLKWAASSTSTLTTAGDLLVASGANTLSRLARGSDNQVLTMNGTALNWETAGGGVTTTYSTVSLGTNWTTTSGSYTDVTGISITIGSSGQFLTGCNVGILTNGVAGTAPIARVVQDSTVLQQMGTGSALVSLSMAYWFSAGGTCGGEDIKLQANAPVSTTTVRSEANYNTTLWTMEIS